MTAGREKNFGLPWCYVPGHLVFCSPFSADIEQGRLAALSRDLDSENENRNICARRGIRQLLLGEQADLLDDTKHLDFITKCDETLKNLFLPLVRNQFIKDSMISNFFVSNISVWTASSRMTLENLEDFNGIALQQLRYIVKLSKQWITTLYPTSQKDGEDRDLSLQLFKTARRLRITSYGSTMRRSYGYDSIQPTCAVVEQLEPRLAQRRIIAHSLTGNETRRTSSLSLVSWPGLMKSHGKFVSNAQRGAICSD